MNFSQRSYQPELLDSEGIAFEAIKKNMQELNTINTWLGGHSITVQGIAQLLSKKKLQQHWVICEMGCGGGDNLLAIQEWCTKNKVSVSFIGIDINPHCIAFAKTNEQLQHCTWICSDYANVVFENLPDIIFSSLFCHHFSEPALKTMFQWMQQNAVHGFFINDLQRHPLAYYSIKILVTIFSSSYLVKNDAPVSVTRGFHKKELMNILDAAAVYPYTIQWKWAFRWLVTVSAQQKIMHSN